MEESVLKQALWTIKNDNYTLKDSSLYETYAFDMLEKIGSIDSVLRDDLIYDVFSNWIINDRFTEEQLEILLEISRNEQHLLYHIGDIESDTVFTRTFSALIIALVLYKHNQKNFLSANTLIQTKDIVLNYYTAEKDLRGYVDTKGWAHSVAHGADVIDELANCYVFGEADLESFLNVLKLKICQGNYVYIDEEVDRVSIAVRSILKRKLIKQETLSQWIDSFKKESLVGTTIEEFHKKINIQNFLKSLYFQLIDDAEYNNLNNLIAGILTS